MVFRVHRPVGLVLGGGGGGTLPGPDEMPLTPPVPAPTDHMQYLAGGGCTDSSQHTAWLVDHRNSELQAAPMH
jgi:hypothetical protein